MNLRQILSRNLIALMESDANLDTLQKLADRTKLGHGTIDRVKKAQVAATIDTVECIAKAFNLEAWQLLVRDITPGNPPALKQLSVTEQSLYAKLQQLISDTKN